eukprot:1450707-Rhodomonas_salina.1
MMCELHKAQCAKHNAQRTTHNAQCKLHRERGACVGACTVGTAWRRAAAPCSSTSSTTAAATSSAQRSPLLRSARTTLRCAGSPAHVGSRSARRLEVSASVGSEQPAAVEG